MKRAGALLAVALLVSLVAVPGVAAAQETRTGSTVVVEEDETVGDLIVVGALAQVPYVGPVVSGFVTLLGIGAATLALRDARRERGGVRTGREA
jgi:hypothetical protein